MPLRVFTTRSREQRSISADSSSRSALSEKSPNDALAIRPCLRRVKGLSDLKKTTPSTTRNVWTTGKKKDWLQEVLAEAGNMSIMGKENVDPLGYQASLGSSASVSNFSFVDEIFHSTPKRAHSILQRKRKSFDLRSEYSSSELSDDSDTTMTSFDVVGQAIGVNCICGRGLNSEMVSCDVCKELCHLDCVGHGQRSPGFFKQNIFFCPGCEQAAFREIAEEGQ